MNKKTLERFVKLQISDEIKINKSDFIINTSISKEHSNKQTLKALKKIGFLTKK